MMTANDDDDDDDESRLNMSAKRHISQKSAVEGDYPDLFSCLSFLQLSLSSVKLKLPKIGNQVIPCLRNANLFGLTIKLFQIFLELALVRVGQKFAD